MPVARAAEPAGLGGTLPAERADPVRVLIVEDHVAVGTGLVLLLEDEGMQASLATGPDGESIVGHAAGFLPHVVLLDLDLGPLGQATPLIQPLAALGAAVVMLTGVTDAYTLAETLAAGATGVLNKSLASDAVVAAVRQAAETGTVMPAFEREERLAELRALRRARDDRLAPFAGLTPREREVLAALCAGHTAGEIAGMMFLSLPTVRAHIRGILTRLGVRSQVVAVALAHRSGWAATEGANYQF